MISSKIFPSTIHPNDLSGAIQHGDMRRQRIEDRARMGLLFSQALLPLLAFGDVAFRRRDTNRPSTFIPIGRDRQVHVQYLPRLGHPLGLNILHRLIAHNALNNCPRLRKSGLG